MPTCSPTLRTLRAKHGRAESRVGAALCCGLILFSSVLLAPPAAALPSPAAQQATDTRHAALIPAPRGEGWMKRHLSFNERVAQGGVDLVFVGDSITQAWEGPGKEVWAQHYAARNAVNLGISGDRTQHVLWRFDHGNLVGIDPRVAVVMIGTNNSNGADHSATEIFEGVRAVVEGLRARLPNTHVLLLDIFPRGEKPNDQRGKILQTNQMLARLDDGDAVHYWPIGHHFIEDDGSISREIMPDFLHLTPAGYQRWAEAIEPELAALMAAERPSVRHSFLAVGHGRPATIVAENGAIGWTYAAPASDGVVLANGNVLLALYPSPSFPKGGAVELTPDGETVFSWKGTQNEVSTACRLDDGRTLVTELGPEPHLLELDAEGKVVHSIDLACQRPNAHMQTRMARKLPDGHYLVPHLLDFAVFEYDQEGAVVRRFPTDQRGREVHDWPFTAIRLPGGNTLIGCTHGNRVIEVGPEGEVVWELTDELLGQRLIHDACGIQRLPGGNTVVTSYAAGVGVKLFEATREGRVVWTWNDGSGAGVHHFQILTTNGRPVRGPALR